MAIASFKKRQQHRVRLRLGPASTCIGLNRKTSCFRLIAKLDCANSNLLALLLLETDVANNFRTFVSFQEVLISSSERRALLHVPNLRSYHSSTHFPVSSFKVLEDWGLHALLRLVFPSALDSTKI